jgi:hypothetical protein
MKTKAIIITATALTCILAVGVWWLDAAPTIGATAASPAYIVVNTPTPVTIMVLITDASLLANGVNLLKTDASGRTLSTVGVMRDDGLNGDLQAGDRTFSYRVNLNQSTVGQVHYRVSAAFRGVLQRALSQVFAVTVDPFPLPPDPGQSGKQTLEGMDSDGDGVRDDVQRYIAFSHPMSPERRAPLSQYAKALRPVELGSAPETAVTDQVSAVRCIAYTFQGQDWQVISGTLRSRMLNTPERLRAYANLRESAPDAALPATRISELSRYCR